MGKFIFTIEAIILYAYYGVLGVFYGQIKTFFDSDLGGWMLFGLIVCIVITLFLPEIAVIVSKDMRDLTIKNIFNKDETINKNSVIIYLQIWCVRIFLGFSVAVGFGVSIPFYTYISPLFGCFGLAGVMILKKITNS